MPQNSPTPIRITPFQQKYVDQLIRIARQDKDYANWLCKEYARIDVFQLGGLAKLVKQEIERLKNETKTH